MGPHEKLAVLRSISIVITGEEVNGEVVTGTYTPEDGSGIVVTTDGGTEFRLTIEENDQ